AARFPLARREDWHLDDDGELTVEAPGGVAVPERLGDTRAYVSQQLNTTFLEHGCKARESHRRIAQPLHPLRRDAVSENGHRVHVLGDLADLGKAFDTQDARKIPVMLPDEVGSISGVEHGTRDDEAEGASHQDGIEGLAGVMKLAVCGAAEPHKDALDQLG